jgi:site-specific DNA recombinase
MGKRDAGEVGGLTRACIYARVSSDTQADQGVSLSAQDHRCRQYADSRGWAVGEVYVDAGYSGKTLERPALQKLLQDARAGRFNVVLVYKLDRLSRRQRDIWGLLEDHLHPLSIGIQSITEPFDTWTPMGKAMLGMLAVFAQLERETIVERTRMGKRERHRQGKWNGGRVPYGYQRVEHGQLAPESHTAIWVEELFTRAAAGESPTTLAQDLSRRGVPTWDHDHRDGTGRAVPPWHANAVRGILRNPVYKGWVRQLGEVRPGDHPPLVDAKTWDAVQRQLAERRRGPRQVRPQFLVDGLLDCDSCGEPLRGTITKRAAGRSWRTADDPATGRCYYYVCARHRRLGSMEAHPARYWRARHIDAQVMEHVTAWLLDPTPFRNLIDRAGPEATGGPGGAAERIRNARREQGQIERRLARWQDAFEREAVDADHLRDRTASLRASWDAWQEHIAAWEAVAASPVAEETQAVLRNLRRIREGWAVLSPLERRAFLWDVGLTGVVDGRGVVHLHWTPGLEAVQALPP